MNKFVLTPTVPDTNRLLAADLGRMLIDLDTTTWQKFAAIEAEIGAFGQLTSALFLPGVNNAYTSLQTEIVTGGIGSVTINNRT